MLTELAVIFLVNAFTSIFKRWIYPKYGKTGVQAVVFILALLGALYVTYNGQFPELKQWIITAAAIFSLAVTFYEVLLSKFDLFKGKEV